MSNISSLMDDYNTFITDNNYKHKYALLTEKMFVIEGSDKVRNIIKENRRRKKKRINKLPNNRILEIGNVGPEIFVRSLDDLLMIIKKENIQFSSTKGVKKPEIQKL